MRLRSLLSKLALVNAGFCVILMCSCSTATPRLADGLACPSLPAEVAMNKGAGRGDLLYLTLRTESGKELLFVVDTGCPSTILDRSLEPTLGKRLGMRFLWYGAYGLKVGGSYAAPNLYLGDTRLLTGRRVATDDLRRRLLNPLAGRPVMGVIGMDCLRHYCVQLDFARGKMLFLNPDQLRTEAFGEAFPLRTIWAEVRAQADFSGNKDTPFRIDTGAPQDIILRAKLYKQQLRGGKTASPQPIPGYREEVTFGGETYTNVIVTKCPLGIRLGYQNLLGLRFLGRHLVTLNFPKQTMYLQRQRVGPLLNEGRTLGWWERRGVSSSDSATEALTKCILSAPNLHRAEVDVYPSVFSWAPPQFIPVGSPKAELKVVELPPDDYHLEYSSTTTNDTRGEAVLAFDYHAEHHSRPTKPMQERGSILLLHDYNGQKEHLAPWAFLLTQAGHRVFLVDLRGHGESTGETVSFGKNETADLCQVLDRLIKQHPSAGRMGILGIGLGANVALYLAARDPRVGPVVAIAPYNQPEQVFKRMAREMKMSISSEILQQALDNVATLLDLKWADWSGESAVSRLRGPVLLIGGGKDSISTTNDLKVLEQAAPIGSKYLLIPQADHWSVAYWFHKLAEPVKTWFQEHQQQL